MPPLDQPGTPHNYSRSSRERVAERRWMLAGFQVVSYVGCMSALLCVIGGEKGVTGALIWDGI